MTRADDIRSRVLDLDATGKSADIIAAIVGVSVVRVDRILDDQDAAQGVPHPDRVRAPILEPLGGPPVITSRAAVGGGRDRGSVPKRASEVKPKPGKPRDPVKPGKAQATPRNLIECGTLPGYHLHRRQGTPTCRPCRDAYNTYNAQKYGRKREPITCGTFRGWKRHHRQGEKPCDDCLAAYRDKQRQWRQASNKPGTADVHADRATLYGQGMSDRQIADRLGVARDVITKWRHRNRLPVNREVS